MLMTSRRSGSSSLAVVVARQLDNPIGHRALFVAPQHQTKRENPSLLFTLAINVRRSIVWRTTGRNSVVWMETIELQLCCHLTSNCTDRKRASKFNYRMRRFGRVGGSLCAEFDLEKVAGRKPTIGRRSIREENQLFSKIGLQNTKRIQFRKVDGRLFLSSRRTAMCAPQSPVVSIAHVQLFSFCLGPKLTFSSIENITARRAQG